MLTRAITLTSVQVSDMNACAVSNFLLGQFKLQAQRANMSTKGDYIDIHDNLAVGADCHDASVDLDYK